MDTKRKPTPVQQALERCKEARHYLAENGMQCMEETHDRCGIIWQRWLVEVKTKGAISVVLFATPHWWDIMVPLTDDRTNAGTFEALKAWMER